jgi:pyruvate,water dikinase
LKKNSSGIGLIRSEHFFIQTGFHPLKLIRTQKEKIKQRISHQIVNFYHRYLNLKHRPPLLVYRSLNLTTNQLLKLSKGQNFESEETNPYLGFRGATRYLNQPEIFNFELELLAHINQKIDKPIVLLAPFVRTSFEWQQLLLHIKKEIKKQVLRPQVWLQLSTPENVYNIEDYLAADLAGISINLKSIHALMHGIDPDFPDIFNQYQLDNQLAITQLELIKQAIDSQSRQITSVINFHQFNQELVRQTVALKYDGITVRPRISKQIKQQIIEREK